VQEFVSGHVALAVCFLDLAEYKEALAFCKVSANSCGYEDDQHCVESADYASDLEQEVEFHEGNNQEKGKEF